MHALNVDHQFSSCSVRTSRIHHTVTSSKVDLCLLLNVLRLAGWLQHCHLSLSVSVANALQAKENEGLRFLTSKAGVIDELEYTMPRWLKRRNPGWYPPYVHILRVSFLWVRLLLMEVCVNSPL